MDREYVGSGRQHRKVISNVRLAELQISHTDKLITVRKSARRRSCMPYTYVPKHGDLPY